MRILSRNIKNEPGYSVWPRTAVYSIALFLLISSIDFAVCPAQEIPLAEQLEGLGPKPKIAYLRHLMENSGGGPELFFQIGLAFHESDMADSALYYYEKAVKADSGMFKAYVNMGVIHDNRGNVLPATKSYGKALQIKPGDVLANSHLALLLYEGKDYQRAMRHLDIALRNGPDNPQPHFYMAIFFWDSMMYREAIREWEKVIQLAESDYLAEKARQSIDMVRRAMMNPGLSGGAPPEE